MDEQRDAADRHGRKIAVDLFQDRLRGAPLLEVQVGDFGGQHAVDDDAIHGEAVQGEVDEGALGFAQHHAFRIGDQAHAGDLGIFHQFADAVEAVEEIFDIGEVFVGRKLDRRDAVGEGADGFQDAALEGKDVLHVPLQRGRHADEAHGFGGGRAIQHDDVVAIFAAELVDVHQRAEFFHAGRMASSSASTSLMPVVRRTRDDVGGDLLPVAFDFLLNIDFVDGELVVDGVRVAGLAVEEVGFEVEGVGQAMRGIDTHDEGAIAQAGELQAGCGGKTGFPNASFAAEEKDAHNLILALPKGEILFNAEAQRAQRRHRRESWWKGGDPRLCFQTRRRGEVRVV